MSLRPHAVACSAIFAVSTLVIATSVTAQGTGRQLGDVVDENGEPMSGVLVTATSTNTGLERTDTTGNDGRFAFAGMGAGIWTFRAELDGYEPSQGSANINQALSQPPLTFELARIRHPLERMLGDDALVGLDAEAIGTELTDADAAFASRDWDAAISGYESVMKQLPQLSNLNMQIAAAYQQKSEFETAIELYEVILASNPDNQDAKDGIARSRLAMGDLSAADDLIATASGLTASREDLFNIGEIEFAKGEVDTAAQWYEKASRLAPNWGLPLFKLALVALNRGDMVGAKEFFQKVIDVDPDSPEAAQAQATLSALP